MIAPVPRRVSSPELIGRVQEVAVLRAIAEHATARSVVCGMLTRGLPVHVDVVAA